MRERVCQPSSRSHHRIVPRGVARLDTHAPQQPHHHHHTSSSSEGTPKLKAPEGNDSVLEKVCARAFWRGSAHASGAAAATGPHHQQPSQHDARLPTIAVSLGAALAQPNAPHTHAPPATRRRRRPLRQSAPTPTLGAPPIWGCIPAGRQQHACTALPARTPAAAAAIPCCSGSHVRGATPWERRGAGAPWGSGRLAGHILVTPTLSPRRALRLQGPTTS